MAECSKPEPESNEVGHNWAVGEFSGDDEVRTRVIKIVESFPEGMARPVAGLHLRLEVRDKRFGWYMENHHGDERVQINCKALPGVQQSLVQSNPIVYHVPKYVGNKGWAGIWMDVPDLNWDQIRDLLFDAYCLTAPKTLLKRLG